MLELCLEFLHEVCKNAYVPVDNNYTLMTMVKFDDHWVFQIDRAEDHMDLADRLVECQYELTDRLAFYLCQRKPGKRKWIRSFFTELLESEKFSKHTLFTHCEILWLLFRSQDRHSFQNTGDGR